jgi:hypothetical protein
MQGDNREQLIRLCERLLAEKDPDTFTEVAKELIAFLDVGKGTPEVEQADSDPTDAPVN